MIQNIDFTTENYMPIMTPKFLSNLYGAYNPQKAVIELVDNSIDGQATTIRITCCENGDTSLTVSDNGIGIKYENMHNVLDFGVSNKTINNNAIGCFGCGLKSVPYHLIDEQFTNNVIMMINTISDGVQTIAERQINIEDTTQKSLIWNVSTRTTSANNGTTVSLSGVNINKKDVEEIKRLLSIRYYRHLRNKKCVIYFNGERILPLNIMFNTVTSVATKKKTLKTNDDKKLSVSIEYVNLDKNNVTLKKLLKERKSKISSETGGIYIFCGDMCITCGGVDSWKHINRKSWTPYNSVRISVDVPVEYKNLILDSDKTKTKTYLADMKTIDGECIFCDVINYINSLLPKQERKKTVINNKEKTVAFSQPSYKSYEEPILKLWNTLPSSRKNTKCMQEIYNLMLQMFDGKTFETTTEVED